MSDGRTLAPQRPELVTDGVPRPGPRWLEMVASTDHKDIGRMFIGASLSFLVLGLVGFLLMRLQLVVPENTLIEPVTFNRLLSVSSASLVALFAVPFAIGLYTYVVPLQIGARQIAFPRMASLALWLYVAGGAILYVSFVYTPPETGFNNWPPLSDDIFTSNNGPDVWITAVGLTVLGLVLQAVNLAVTVSRLRAPGLAWRRLPPFSFSAAVSSWVLLVAGAAMLAALGHADDRSQLQRRLLQLGRGRRAGLLPAPELDLLQRLLRDLPAAGDRRDLGDSPHLLRQAAALAGGRGRVHGGDRSARAARLDAEHVHRRDPGGLALHGDGRRRCCSRCRWG